MLAQVRGVEICETVSEEVQMTKLVDHGDEFELICFPVLGAPKSIRPRGCAANQRSCLGTPLGVPRIGLIE